MALVEAWANYPSTTVSSGGATAPSPGTVESWTVASSAGFPPVTSGVSQFHVADKALPGEVIAVTAVSGTSWTVTRGAEGTSPVAHAAGLTVVQVVTAGWLGRVATTGQANGVLAPAVAALTDAATITVDASLGNSFTVTLGGNRTLGNPASPVDGQQINLAVTQDATGSRTLAYGTAYAFSTSLPSPTLSTGSGATDYLAFIYSAIAGKWRLTAFVSGF